MMKRPYPDKTPDGVEMNKRPYPDTSPGFGGLPYTSQRFFGPDIVRNAIKEIKEGHHEKAVFLINYNEFNKGAIANMSFEDLVPVLYEHPEMHFEFFSDLGAPKVIRDLHPRLADKIGCWVEIRPRKDGEEARERR